MANHNQFTRLAKIVFALGSVTAAAAIIQLAFTLWARKARHKKFAIPGEHALTNYIDFNAIVYVEGADNYTKLFCLNNSTL